MDTVVPGERTAWILTYQIARHYNHEDYDGIPPGAWMFVCCDCCVLSGRGLCDGLIARSEGSYRPWRVTVCDQVTSYVKRL